MFFRYNRRIDYPELKTCPCLIEPQSDVTGAVKPAALEAADIVVLSKTFKKCFLLQI